MAEYEAKKSDCMHCMQKTKKSYGMDLSKNWL
jgi:hypothetical protein